MTNSEFRIKLLEVANVDWFNNIKVSIDFPYINFSNQFIGLSSLFEFINQQISGWEKLGESIPDRFKESKNYFTNYKNAIINFRNNYFQQNDLNSLNSNWESEKSRFQQQNTKTPFIYNCPQAEFLLRVFNESSKYFNSAFDLIADKSRIEPNDKNNLIGYILAYEFLIKGNEISERKNAEKSSISKIRNDFSTYLSKTENDVVNYLNDTKNKYNEYVSAIDKFKTDKETFFNEWYDSTKKGFEDFDSKSKQKIIELETTYNLKLKLEEPAKFWSDRAKYLKRQGWIAMGVLIALVVLSSVFLAILLWNSPETIFISWFKEDKSAAIRWTLLFITLLSLIAYGIRAVNKVMFSSFHLARDCEERHTLTYFYLSLLKDSKVDEKDRQLIMQSLFSRADTGLLKEDSSPTMPTFRS
jgi:hypothetical protein